MSERDKKKVEKKIWGFVKKFRRGRGQSLAGCDKLLRKMNLPPPWTKLASKIRAPERTCGIGHGRALNKRGGGAPIVLRVTFFLRDQMKHLPFTLLYKQMLYRCVKTSSLCTAESNFEFCGSLTLYSIHNDDTIVPTQWPHNLTPIPLCDCGLEVLRIGVGGHMGGGEPGFH